MGTEHTAEPLRWGVNLGKNSAFKPPQLPKKRGPKFVSAKTVKISTGKPPEVKFKPINASTARTLESAHALTPSTVHPTSTAREDDESLVKEVEAGMKGLTV